MASNMGENKPDAIPVVNDLAGIYTSSSLLAQGKRWNDLQETFQKLHGQSPEWIARAPGRASIFYRMSMKTFSLDIQ
jgi:hypothetical protein